MNRAPTIAGGRYIPAFHRNVNALDAFSHSAHCDEQFSKLSDIPGGQPHAQCNCWCHKVALDNDVEPEYDPGL